MPGTLLHDMWKSLTRSRLATVWLGLVLWTGTASAQGVPLRSELYVGGFTQPVGFVQHPTDPGVQFVVEQTGRIRVIQNGALVAAPFLDLSAAISNGGERGLLGLAFAPDYADSRRFFVNFTRHTDGHTVVARFTRSATDPLVADPSSRFDLTWSTGLPYIVQPFANHNGGHIAFGPDGYLYIGNGDGGSGGDPQNHAQNPDSLLGKMLRIDVDVLDNHPHGFIVPADNPFVSGQPIFARPEIWAFGLRNPWRWSFDDPMRGGTGALIVGDVGQSNWEEINYEPAGAGGRNYGWRIREGAHVFIDGDPPYEPLIDPIFEMDRTVATSVTGGMVYRGSALGEGHTGRYFFADFPGSRVYSIGLQVDPVTGEASALDFRNHTAELAGATLVSSFGADADGELYTVSWGSGEIRRIAAQTEPPGAATLTSPAGIIGTVKPVYVWQPVSASEWYYLWVTDRTGVRIQRWYPASSAGCGGGTGACSANPGVGVAPGLVTWWIQTWNRTGFGPWSNGATFTASPPGPVSLSAPGGAVPTSLPTYTWQSTPLATWYQLWVNQAGGNAVKQWYPASQAGCAGGGSCSVTPAIPLRPGAATWWIQPWNDVGLGPWSAGMSFAVAPPGATTLVSPSGSISTPTPSYVWQAVPTATWYYLWVNDDLGTPRVQRWFPAADVGCAAGTGSCTITPTDFALEPGRQAFWWIQTWNEAGFGPWSAQGSFFRP